MPNRIASKSAVLLPVLLVCLVGNVRAQANRGYTRADSLRGALDSPARNWWDVTFYDLHVTVRPADSTIHGFNTVAYRVLEPAREMQIDLQEPLEVDSVVQHDTPLHFRRDGDAWFVTPASNQPVGSVQTLTIYYGGSPHVARRPPWDGGFTWAADSLGRPWWVTTDEEIGPSIWWPLKDTWADEPDSANVAITLPNPLVQVGNGRLRSVVPNGDGTTTWEWFASSPINPYAINVNAGNYTHYLELFPGERGMLTLDFWPLDYNVEKARKQFAQGTTMMACFEHWFGPYPWYEDGYKLVDVPYPGMEHQSAVTYGNGYANGYGGRDGSGTGLGMEWDFIIVHESAHEWFANNITARDHADMWVHEAFANYAENLYTECQFGKEHPERPAHHPGLRGGRSGLGGHVSQGRESPPHHPTDRRKRREVAGHPPGPESDLPAADGGRLGDRGLYQPRSRRGPEQGLRPVPPYHHGPGPGVSNPGEYALLPVGGGGPGIQHAGGCDPHRRRLHRGSAQGSMADGQSLPGGSRQV